MTDNHATAIENAPARLREAAATEQERRAALVAEARTWLRTKWHHEARVKGAGVDCGQLIIACAEACGLVAPIATGSYPMDWNLHRDEERYLGFVRAHIKFEFLGPPEPGDVVVFHYGRTYAHGAIVAKASPLTVIHAFRPAGMVVEDILRPNSELMAAKRGRKPPLYFSFWPKAPTAYCPLPTAY